MVQASSSRDDGAGDGLSGAAGELRSSLLAVGTAAGAATS
jgi:hypothetical protein